MRRKCAVTCPDSIAHPGRRTRRLRSLTVQHLAAVIASTTRLAHLERGPRDGEVRLLWTLSWPPYLCLGLEHYVHEPVGRYVHTGSCTHHTGA